jgi:phytoene desaturase
MKKVIIIGSGMGGMATALRLAYSGFEVTVLEKQSRLGGRSNLIEEIGFRVDTGPTILVMKDTFEELYRAVGQNINKRIDLIQLDPNYRIYFHDNTFIDLYNNMALLAQEVEKIGPGSAVRLFRFLGSGAMKYELGMDFVDRNYNHITDLANPSALSRLLITNAHQDLYKQVKKYFNDNEKLTKAFSFHSMFLGLSPFDALAMYSLITYADLALGMWFPKGGIYSIIEDMNSMGLDMGVNYLVNSPVSQIIIKDNRAAGVQLQSGEKLFADLVVSNADLPYTYKDLLEPNIRKDYTDKDIDRFQYACSGYILFLGVDKIYPNMRHQALYFAEDYRANLDAIFVDKVLPEELSFHMNIPTITDPSLAPPGHSLIYLLAPMPNLTADINWDKTHKDVRDKLIHKLETIIDPKINQHIVWERSYCPTDWYRDINAFYGTAFGSLSHTFFQSSYFRPHNRSRYIKGLYFVGQGTYPGIGMPMVIISSKLVTERILEEWN